MHKEFAFQLKQTLIGALDERRKQLSMQKKSWIGKIDSLKRQIKDANEIYKKEH